ASRRKVFTSTRLVVSVAGRTDSNDPAGIDFSFCDSPSIHAFVATETFAGGASAKAGSVKQSMRNARVRRAVRPLLGPPPLRRGGNVCAGIQSPAPFVPPVQQRVGEGASSNSSITSRSEERRVGQECRRGGAPTRRR